MHANRGDRIVVPGLRVGMPERVGKVVEVRGDEGTPPYVVRWQDRPGEHLYFPGADARLERPIEDVDPL